MSERQKHGFDIENSIRQLYGYSNIDPKTNCRFTYTDPHDAYDQKDNVYCQIKSIKHKGGMLMMGNPYRYLEYRDNIRLIIQMGSNIIYNNIVNFQELFKQEQLKERCEATSNLLSSVSNDRSDDLYFRQEFKKIEKDKRQGRILQVQAKRDHKHQKRVQWAVSSKNLETFLNLIKV